MGRNMPAHHCCLGTPPQARRAALPWRVSAHERKQTSGTQRGEERDRGRTGYPSCSPRLPPQHQAPGRSSPGLNCGPPPGLQLETWHSCFVANYPLFFLPSSAHYSFSTKIWSHNLTVQLIAFPKFLCYSPCIYCMLGGQGGLACCSPWGRKESDTTERLN